MNRIIIATVAAVSAACFIGGCSSCGKESQTSSPSTQPALAGVKINDPQAATTMPTTAPAEETAVVAKRDPTPFTDIGTLKSTEEYLNGLRYSIAVSNRALVVGQNVDVTLTVTNTTDRAITIPADGTSQANICVYRNDGVGWDGVKTYPQAQVVVMRHWQIAPGQKRTLTFSIPVEPDWPTAEKLMITGELNGLPYQKAATPVRVQPSGYAR